MDLKKEIEAMDQLVEFDETGHFIDSKLDVNTVIEAINQKQEQLLSLEEVYRMYSKDALEALQEEVMDLVKDAVVKQKEVKEKEDIELPSSEFVSRSAILEAVSRMEEQIDYHNEKLNQALKMQADSLGDYLASRNLDDEYITQVKEYYMKHGEITSELREDILNHIHDFLSSKHENEGNVEMVKEVVQEELNSIRMSFQNYALPPRMLRYTTSAYLSKYSNVSYIDLDKYLKTKNGFDEFVKDYKVDQKLMEHLINDKNNEKNMDELWNSIVQNGFVNPDQPYQDEVRTLFEKEVNTLIVNRKKALDNDKKDLDSAKKESDTEKTHQETVTDHFRTLCRNMSFSEQQTNELLESIKENKKTLQFKDGTSMYRALKEQIIPAQQQKIPMNGNREETIQACQQLIKERQEFFQNVYQYRSMIKKDPNKKNLLSEGKKIINQRKNKDRKVSNHVFAAIISREKAALAKFKKRHSKPGNYSLTVGSIVHIPFDNASDLAVRVNAIKVFDEKNGRPYYSASHGETIEELIQMHQLDKNSKLSFGCEVYTEDGRHRWIEYDPYNSFAYDEDALVKGSNKVR